VLSYIDTGPDTTYEYNFSRKQGVTTVRYDFSYSVFSKIYRTVVSYLGKILHVKVRYGKISVRNSVPFPYRHIRGKGGNILTLNVILLGAIGILLLP